MKYQIIIPIEYKPATRPRVTRYGTYYSKSYQHFRDQLEEWYKTQKPKEKLEGPISLSVSFEQRVPKYLSKKKQKELLSQLYCTNRNDLDNLCKRLMDFLQGKYFEDDRQIVILKAEKLWVDKNPQTNIILTNNLLKEDQK